MFSYVHTHQKLYIYSALRMNEWVKVIFPSSKKKKNIVLLRIVSPVIVVEARFTVVWCVEWKYLLHQEACQINGSKVLVQTPRLFYYKIILIVEPKYKAYVSLFWCIFFHWLLIQWSIWLVTFSDCVLTCIFHFQDLMQ